MDDVKNEAAEVEKEPVPKHSDGFLSRLNILALSAARQTYCYCSVLVFPLFYPVFNIVYLTPVVGGSFYSVFMSEVNKSKMLTIGLLVGAILLRSIGRKCMVIAVNLLELIFFVYSYLANIEEWVPYKLVFAHHFVAGIGFVTFFVYLSEITSPIFRASFLATYTMMQMILKLEYVKVLHAQNMNKLYRNGSIVAALTLLLSFYTPETPYWLAFRGNPEKAKETFKWLRAGNPDMAEFNQMLARAEYIVGNKLWRPLMTLSFVICVIFSFLLMVGSFKFCTLMISVTHTFYTPHTNVSLPEYQDIRDIIYEHQKYEYQHTVYGHLFFLLFNFVLPRKVLYFTSYITGVLSIVPIGLRMMSPEILKKLASYCNLTPLIGTIQLNQILPVEIYPTALREIGVAFTASLAHPNHYLDWRAFDVTSWWNTPGSIAQKTLVFFRFYVSLITIPFLLILMPETKDTSVFEYDELKLNLHRRSDSRHSAEGGEGPRRSVEEGKGRKRSAEEGEGRKRSAEEGEGQKRSAEEGEGRKRSAEEGEGRKRSAEEGEGRKRSAEKNEGPVADVKGPVADVKGPVADVKGPVADVKGPVADVKGPVADVKGPVADVKGPVADVKGPVPEDKGTAEP